MVSLLHWRATEACASTLSCQSGFAARINIVQLVMALCNNHSNINCWVFVRILQGRKVVPAITFLLRFLAIFGRRRAALRHYLLCYDVYAALLVYVAVGIFSRENGPASPSLLVRVYFLYVFTSMLLHIY